MQDYNDEFIHEPVPKTLLCRDYIASHVVSSEICTGHNIYGALDVAQYSFHFDSHIDLLFYIIRLSTSCLFSKQNTCFPVLGYAKTRNTPLSTVSDIVYECSSAMVEDSCVPIHLYS